MARLHKVLEELLVEAGALKTIEMGPPSTEVPSPAEVKERLMEGLPPRAKFNDRFLILIIVTHYLCFIAPFLLVYYYRNSLALISAVLAVTLPSLVLVMRLLSDLWKTKAGIDILITQLPTLPPEQSVEAVKALYYALSKPSSGRSTITDQSNL
jgi:hypothetical protein